MPGILPSSTSLSLTFLCANGSRRNSLKFTVSCCSLDWADKKIRLGLPNKGRLANDTHDLLKECQLPINQGNPRQYVAEIRGFPNIEVWYQRPTSILGKLLSEDLDLGIVGLDTVCEYGQGSEDLVIVHDDLDYGQCRLSLAIPRYGIFENINAIKELAAMPQWTFKKPMRVATGCPYLTRKFLEENGFENGRFVISIADGAVEAAPAMGIADIIMDTVGTGTTLKENNLKEIEGGKILQSQAVLVGSRKSLLKRYVLETTREILDRLEAHLKASKQLLITANMRGNSFDEVADRVLRKPLLTGLQGPTISPVKSNEMEPTNFFAIVICVHKDMLYKAIQQLREIGGSGVLVTPLTYIFDEEPERWLQLLKKLGIDFF